MKTFDEIAAAAAKNPGAKLILTTTDGKSWMRWTGDGCSAITEEEIKEQCKEHSINYELLHGSQDAAPTGAVGVIKWEVKGLWGQ